MELLNLSKKSGILDLSKVAPSLKQVKGHLNWNPHPVNKSSHSDGFDLDIFVFALNDKERISGLDDVSFFNNKRILNGLVEVPKDNRTGEGDDDEEFTIKLNEISSQFPNKSHFDVFVFIHEAEVRQQNFGMISGAVFTVLDGETGKTIQSYSLSQFTNATTVHIGRISKGNGGWTFTPIGADAIADPNQVASAYC